MKARRRHGSALRAVFSTDRKIYTAIVGTAFLGAQSRLSYVDKPAVDLHDISRADDGSAFYLVILQDLAGNSPSAPDTQGLLNNVCHAVPPYCTQPLR